MTIRRELFDYLEHFGRTVPVRELADPSCPADCIALRHDIDHNLDLALELGHHEHQLGLRATYYLLHTHDYWNDPDLAIKCRQLQEYGHEVGLHLNALSLWFDGGSEDMNAAIQSLLAPLRKAGVTITGTSAHGDRACYQHGFINYWIWRELRGDDPAQAQRGLSAEGIAVDDERWQIAYPVDHALRRSDGASLALWQCSLAEHGLDYDAIHTPFEHYWTDTGGQWSRTGDPLQHDLTRGRHQVLIHPWWWRAPTRLYFFLSTARCGTRWLSNFIDKATSATGVHEFTFNHHYSDDEIVSDKRTTDDYDTLCTDRKSSVNLIRDALRWMRQQPGDVAEANVYLEPFLTELRELAPESTLVHLYRDGRAVVRSILNRDWYASPQDHKHRAVPIDGWEGLTQFERACWYWRYTNESIMPHTTARLCFERMTSDLTYLSQSLQQLGIVVHPLLAAQVFDTPMNESRETAFAHPDDWPAQYHRTFETIGGALQSALGYGSMSAASTTQPSHTPERLLSTLPDTGRCVLDLDFCSSKRPAISARNVSVSATPDGLEVRATTDDPNVSNRVLLLCKGSWSSVTAKCGIACEQDVYYSCAVDSCLDQDLRVRLFVLFYDRGGSLMRKLQLGTLRSEAPHRVMSFSPPVDASHCALALHLGAAQPSQKLTLMRVRVDVHTMDRRYAVKRNATLNPAGRPSAVTG